MDDDTIKDEPEEELEKIPPDLAVGADPLDDAESVDELAEEEEEEEEEPFDDVNPI